MPWGAGAGAPGGLGIVGWKTDSGREAVPAPAAGPLACRAVTSHTAASASRSKRTVSSALPLAGRRRAPGGETMVGAP
jgi:hypothetical protein